MFNNLSILNEIEWNKTEKTFDDFAALAERLNVRWFYHDGVSEGMYFTRRGLPIIILNTYLTGAWLNFVAWHEMAHFLLGHDGLRYYVASSREIAEKHANIIAACAIIPEPKIYEIAFGAPDIWNYPKEIIQLRLKAERDHQL